MEIALIILAFVLLFGGIAGSFLPVIPGLPLSWLGILSIYLIPSVPFNWTILITSAVVVVLISLLDFVFPSLVTKRYGGSKYGIWGTNIGLIVGILAPIPLGFLIGPFLGAFIGEWFFNKSDEATSLRAATGSFIGFIASTFMKFVIAIVFLGLACYLIWTNRGLIF